MFLGVAFTCRLSIYGFGRPHFLYLERRSTIEEWTGINLTSAVRATDDRDKTGIDNWNHVIHSATSASADEG